jgi:hypothetical protein
MRSPSRTAGQQIGRIAHRLHAASHRNLDVAGGDALCRQHDGLEPGAADLVDGQRGDVIRQPAVQRGLAWRGFWPFPAWMTLPMMHSSTVRDRSRHA